MKTRFSLFPLLLLASLCAFAEGTRTWEQSSYNEFEKGTAKGVVIRSDGTLELAPAFQSLTTTPSTYIWSIASGPDGAVYAAAGSPARVYQITPDGKWTVLLQPPELQVQALALSPDGTICAATSPDGKVYRIERNAAQPSGWKTSVIYEPQTKYIWDLALDRTGNLYVATGDRGEIFRVDRNGTGSLFFKSDEAHIRRLAFDQKGNLIAGSDGSGLIYRISPQGEAFVLYSASKKEITALAVDDAGNIYAAGVGEKRGAAAPAPAATAVPAPAAQPAPASGVASPVVPPVVPAAIGPVGSEVYRIAADGSTTLVWSSREETVYALGFDAKAHLLIGTGNKGRVFSVQNAHEFTDLVKASASQVTSFARAPNGGLYVGTSNLGKIFLLSSTPVGEGTYESDVFDAHNFSRWGRAEVRGTGTYELWARSGNVDNPDRNWSPWSRVDLAKGAELTVPSARFVQWKSILRPGNPEPNIESIQLNYLQKNVAPVIEEVVVQPGAHFSFANLAAAGSPRTETLPSTVHDRNSIAVRWSARDDNEDQLVYTLYYRGDRETRWKLLKSGLTDKYYSFDADLLPDGGYTLKVVASDAPSHSPGEALTDERISQHFDLDTTPPRIEALNAAAQSNAMRVTFRATDTSSDIKRAEYSVDAGDWVYIEPRGKLSDSRTEDYEFSVPVTASGAGEHVIVVRVWDRFDNMASAKTVTQTK